MSVSSLNKYFATSIVILSVFVLLALLLIELPSEWNYGLLLSSFSIISADKVSFLYINDLHRYVHTVITQIMIWLTQYGREGVWPIVVVLLFFKGGWTGKKSALVMTLSFAILIPITRIVKEIIARPRPIMSEATILLEAESQYAFPSGHTVIVAAGAVIALLTLKGTRKGLVISLALTIEAFLVSFSRVYVGAHYPLDIVGGVLLGVGVSLLFVWKMNIFERILMIITPSKKSQQKYRI